MQDSPSDLVLRYVCSIFLKAHHLFRASITCTPVEISQIMKNNLHCMLLRSLLLYLRAYTIVLKRRLSTPQLPCLTGGIAAATLQSSFSSTAAMQGMLWNGCLCLLCNRGSFQKDSKWHCQLISARLPPLSFLFFFLHSAIWKYKRIASPSCSSKKQCSVNKPNEGWAVYLTLTTAWWSCDR